MAEWLGAMALALALLVLVANLVVVQYVRAAARLAVDEAARHGAAMGRGSTECFRRGEEVLRGSGGVLGGVAGRHIEVSCSVEAGDGGGVVIAVAEGPVPGLVPGMPGIWIRAESTSVVEAPP